MSQPVEYFNGLLASSRSSSGDSKSPGVLHSQRHLATCELTTFLTEKHRGRGPHVGEVYANARSGANWLKLAEIGDALLILDLPPCEPRALFARFRVNRHVTFFFSPAVRHRASGVQKWLLPPIQSRLTDSTRMFKAYQRLLLVLACATDKQLAKQVQYLKAENEILRARLPKQISTTPAERRRLLKLGRPLGAAIKDLITIVKPDTFAIWVRKARKNKPTRKVGRPRTVQPIQDLVLQIARETGWGYTRVLGELRKLTNRKVSRQTVVNIMRAHGLDPGPKRGEKTWDEFIRIHAQTLWQCDFFTKPAWTLNGLRDFYVLAFLHVGSRKVFVSPATDHPNAEWVVAQAESFCRHVEAAGANADLVFHDSDTKLCQAFDGVLKAK